MGKVSLLTAGKDCSLFGINKLKNQQINMTQISSSFLRRISEWVEHTFLRNPTDSERFNVHSYSREDKIQGILELEKLGYKCELDNNENSLVVTP
jgi:hypothetical protein